MDKDYEAHLDAQLVGCQRGIAQLCRRQQVLRQARLLVRLGVATPVVKATITEALTRRPARG